MHAAAHNVLDAIGNTPLVELRRVIPPGAARVVAKIETPEGRAHYEHEQRTLAAKATALRQKLLESCNSLAAITASHQSSVVPLPHTGR